MKQLGVDVGGTFTDAVLWDSKTGEIRTSKAATTPHDVSEGVISAIDELTTAYNEIDVIVHGTTVGINTMLQKKLPKVGMLVTKGFRDLLDIQRIYKHWGKTYWSSPYDLQSDKPDAIVRRYLRGEVDERVTYPGTVIKVIDEDNVREAACALLKEEGLTGIAVVYLWSFLHPDHELKTRKVLRDAGYQGNIALSHEVAPIFHEFERMITTVINASLMEVMGRYIANLEKQLKDRKFSGRLAIMQSSGGLMDVEMTKKRPIYTLISGPAGGVTAGKAIADLCQIGDVITADVGGTTFDVSVIQKGRVETVLEKNFLEYLIRIPFLNIHSIGAGGGSIVWIDKGSALRVGPESAGAEPGPACYGNSELPTITDCNLILGRLDSETFFGGRQKLDVDRARSAMEPLASQLRLKVEDAAELAVQVVNTNMAAAISMMTVERGVDPEEFSIIAFGGGGGLHLVDIGVEMGARSVIMPETAPHMSALGLAVTSYRHVASFTKLQTIQSVPVEEIESAFRELEEEATKVLQDYGVKPQDIELHRIADMRYHKEEWNTQVDVPRPLPSVEVLANLFTSIKSDVYATERTIDEPIDAVNYHVVGIGHPAEREFDWTVLSADGGKSESRGPLKSTKMFINAKWEESSVYDRGSLAKGQKIAGPALIEADAQTVFLPKDYSADVDSWGNLVIDLRG